MLSTMVEVTSGELVIPKEATCSEETLPPGWESQAVPEYKHFYKRRRRSSAERRNTNQLIKSPGHESFSAAPQEVLQPDEVVLQGSKGREGIQQAKSTSPSAAPLVPHKICQRPTLPRKAKKRSEAIPIFKRKSRQRKSLQKLSTPECSPEVARPALSGRGVTREEPSPIAHTRSLGLRKENSSYSEIDFGKEFGEDLPSTHTRSQSLRKENRRYSENDYGKDFGEELTNIRSIQSRRVRKENRRYSEKDYAKDFDEEFESEYEGPGEGSSQDHDYHPQGRKVLSGVQVVSEQSTSETAHPVKSWIGRRRRSSNAQAFKLYLSMSSPSMVVSLETEGKVNNVGQTHESAKSGDMACKSSKKSQNNDNMTLGTLSRVIPLCFPNPHPRLEEPPSSDNSPQGPQTPEKLQKRKRGPSREELLPTQRSTPEQDVRSSSGNTTPPMDRLLTTVTTKDAIVRRPLLPPSGPLSCGIIPEVCINPSRGFDRVPEPTYQTHTVDLPGSLPRGSLSPDSPKALSIFVDLSPYFLDSQKEVTTVNTQAVASRALAEAPLLGSESRGIGQASLASGVSFGHHLVFPSLIAGSSQKDVETCTTDPDSLLNNVHAFPMQPSPPGNGHSEQNLQEKVMEQVHQEMHHMKGKVRRKKYTPKVKKATKPKVPKIPKEKNMLQRNSRTSRYNGSGVLTGGFNCGVSDELNATNNYNRDSMLKKARMEKPSSPEPEGQNPFPSFTEVQPCNLSKPANRAPSPCPTMVIDMKRIMRKPRSVRKQRRANKNKLMTYVDVDLELDPNDVADNAIENPLLTGKTLLREKKNLGDGMAQPAHVSLLSRVLDHEISTSGSESNLMLRKAVADPLTPEYSAQPRSSIDGSKMEGLQVVRDKEVCEASPVQSSDPLIEDLNGAPSTSPGRQEHIFQPFVEYSDQEVPSSTSPFMSFVNYQTSRTPPDVVQEQIPSRRDECVQSPCPLVEDVPTTPKGNLLTVALTMEESPIPESPLSPLIRCVENTGETSSPDCGSGVLCIKRNSITGLYQCNPKPVRRSLLPQFDSVGQNPEVSLVPSPQDPPKKSRPWKNTGQHRILDQPTPFTRMKRSDKVKYMRRLSDEYEYSALMGLMSRELTDTQLSEVKSLLFNQNAPSEQDLQIVAYKGAVKDIVLYQAPLLWRRKVKFKPKVGLDSETLTMFRRLMIKGGAVEDDDTDDAKWEGIRSYWRFKADHFNNIMHQIQGDRTFSKWGGSVMDSLVGAFLTQNVSDFLSSSAFMSLRARFPARNATESSTGASGGNEKPSDGAGHSSKVPNGFPERILPEQISFSNLDSVTQDICIDKSSSQILVENFKRLQLAKALKPLLYRDLKSEIAEEISTPSQSKVAMVEYIPDRLVSGSRHEVVEEPLEEVRNIGVEHTISNAKQAITFPATQAEIAVERSHPWTPNRPGIAKAAVKNITQSAKEKAINSSLIEIETVLVGKSTNCPRPDGHAEIPEQNLGEVSMDIFVPQRRSKALEELPYLITRSEIDTEGNPSSPTVIGSLPEATNDSTEEVGMEKTLEEFPCPVTQCVAAPEDPVCPSTVRGNSHEAMDDSYKEVGMGTALEEFPSPVNQSDIDREENPRNPTLISSLHNAMDDSVEEVGINTALEEFSHPVTQSDIDTEENPINPTVSSRAHEAIDDSAPFVGINTALQELPYPVTQSEIDEEKLITVISSSHEAMDDSAQEVGISTATEELPYSMIPTEIATQDWSIPSTVISSLHEVINKSPEKVGMNKAVCQFREQASGILISSTTQIEMADADIIDDTVHPGSQSEQDSVEWTATLAVTQSMMKAVEETILNSGGPASFSDDSCPMDSILENRLAPEGTSRMEVSFEITAEASNEIVPRQCLRETVQISAVVSPTERSQFDVQGKFNIVSKGKSDILTREEQEHLLAATLRSILGKKTTSRTEAQDQVRPLDLQKLRHSSTKLTRKTSRIMNKVQYRLLSGSDRARWEQGLAVKSQRDKWEPLRSKILAKEGYARPSTTDDCIDWEAVRLADVAEVADVIKDRGMNNVLAGRIKSCLERIHQDQCGSLDLEWIRKLPPDDAKDFLLSIRGLGLKSVECIRLLTLHHPSFPVDTNVGRIAVRLGWVPLEPLPEETQLHLLELYPIQAHIQQYLWPRLCKLDQQTLYELHYQMITFGKVFCTKSKPNCNACPMRSECKHFASAYASARPLLTGPEERGPSTMLALPSTEPVPQSNEAPQFLSVELSMDASGGSCNPIIEEPSTPEETYLVDDTLPDIEDGPGSFYIELGTKSSSEAEVSDSISYLNIESRLTMDHKVGSVDLNTDPLLGAGVAVLDLEASPSDNLAKVMHSVKAMKMDSNMGMTIENVAEEPTSQVALPEFQSQELILLPPQAAYIPVPQLKNIQRLRTVHYVYELPDDHPLLAEMDKRLADDPCFYLLAIWSPDEVPESMPKINDEDATNPFASCSHGEGPETVKGTLLVPCRTAMRGCFPLNGTYFQVNEVFADYASSIQPIEVPRTLLWSLQRRFVYFGTAVTNLFRGMTQEEIQCCFKKGYVCVRAFDQKTRKPKLLAPRLHQSSANIKPNTSPGPSVRRGRGPSVNRSVKVRVTKTTQSMSMVPS